MAYLGNKDGPRESDILNHLGPGYFGCSPAQLEEDISYHLYAESRNEVVPVHIDEDGRPYIEFSSPDPERINRYVLEEHDYLLKGEIKTFSNDEQLRWQERFDADAAPDHTSP
jgi:hypothetical protein